MCDWLKARIQIQRDVGILIISVHTVRNPTLRGLRHSSKNNEGFMYDTEIMDSARHCVERGEPKPLHVGFVESVRTPNGKLCGVNSML